MDELDPREADLDERPPPKFNALAAEPIEDRIPSIRDPLAAGWQDARGPGGADWPAGL